MSGVHLAADDPDLVGASTHGDTVSEATYLPVGERAVSVSGPWQPVSPQGGTEAWVYRLAQQEPDKDTTEQVIVTRRAVGQGSIVAVHGPLFQNYAGGHYPDVRAFVAGLVDRLRIPWLVEVDGPPRLEVILRHKEGKLVVNLINRGAGEALSPQRVIVDELQPVRDVVVRLYRPERPRAVTVVPADSPLDWTHEGGRVTITLPRVDIHSAIIVE